ncbi:precorrin-3B synthase [Mangrovihabitans endophyticus]|uniref:Precorrin-3B synthase n=1 Tax=Mangrovihabitans endophyticus TaxID=1751298 RepID=A0A8J3C506_9ACTN|nr:precorrin-3B synthase [Mangrovihabitans endophyticus]GGL18569.1 precorrin-3B synthase [Mangrovihabitans endophyticus]
MPAIDRRADADACPGALRLHAAADGPLARIRLPGGLLTGAQLAVVRDIADRWGDGHAELTSRANLQLRAVTGAPAGTLADRLGGAGLLPSPSHELVRNILGSPLPTAAAVAALVADLDARLCADPALAALPGRFLFALDSGHGDVAGAADVAAVFGETPAAEVRIIFAGQDPGLRVDRNRAVTALLAAAHAFLDERAVAPGPDERAAGSTLDRTERPSPPAWRLRELPDGPARVAARTAVALELAAPTGAPSAVPPARPPAPPVGVHRQPDGGWSAGALVPLGRLRRHQMSVLSAAPSLVITPWRGVLVTGLPRDQAGAWLDRFAAAGLEVRPDSPWAGVTTCAGRPCCAKALADVRTDAGAAVAADGARPSREHPADRLPVHWIGCARGCGSPAGPHVRVEATGDDYLVRAPSGAWREPHRSVGARAAEARAVDMRSS